MKHQDLLEASHAFEEPEGSSNAYYSGIVSKLINSPHTMQRGPSNAKHKLIMGHLQICTDSDISYKYYKRLFDMLAQAFPRAIAGVKRAQMRPELQLTSIDITPSEFRILAPLLPPIAARGYKVVDINPGVRK